MVPSRTELRWVHARLERQHGPRRPGEPRRSVLDGLVATILSQSTTSTNSSRAFAALTDRFPSWDAARRASPAAIERAIRSGGLARQKARRIHALLGTVFERHGATSLDHLRKRPSEEVRAELSGLPGVGPKTISCVLLFTLGRPDFPVDTHVHRILRRLGWAEDRWSAEATYAAMGPVVPSALAYSLHVLLVTHGRTTCRARVPRCAACLLAPRCPAGRERVVAR